MNNIFLIRHGQSEANADRKVYATQLDSQIKLTEIGVKQAQLTGKFLKEHFSLNDNNTVLISSSFRRAIDTAEHLQIASDVFTDDRIVERSFGAFNGHEMEEIRTQFGKAGEYYYSRYDKGDRYFLRPLLGESASDVELRIRSFLNDLEKREIYRFDNIVIVAHGTANLILTKVLANHTYKWYSDQENPKNGSVIHLQNSTGHIIDCGYIFVPPKNFEET